MLCLNSCIDSAVHIYDIIKSTINKHSVLCSSVRDAIMFRLCSYYVYITFILLVCECVLTYYCKRRYFVALNLRQYLLLYHIIVLVIEVGNFLK